MNKYVLIALSPLALCCGLFSCAGEPDPSTIALNFSDTIRQIQTVDNAELHVDIRVNDSATQTFSMRTNELQVPIFIAGVKREQENSIEIRWYEYFEGTRLDLSVQREVFIADGNTVINTPHDFLGFDFDSDGISNFDERIAGSCVWATTGPCENPDNLLMNGQFNQGSEYWWTIFVEHSINNAGEFCSESPATATNILDAQFGYIPTLSIAGNSAYTIRFDVRSRVKSEITVILVDSMSGDNPVWVFEQRVSVSENYEPQTLVFDNNVDELRNLDLVVLVGNGMENTYCVDNFSFVKVAQ